MGFIKKTAKRAMDMAGARTGVHRAAVQQTGGPSLPSTKAPPSMSGPSQALIKDPIKSLRPKPKPITRPGKTYRSVK